MISRALLICAVAWIQSTSMVWGSSGHHNDRLCGDSQKEVCADSFQISEFYAKQYRNAEMRYAFRENKLPFTVWQTNFRSALKETLGIARLEKDLAGYEVKSQKLTSEDVGYALREQWVIWTEPDVPMSIVVLRPKGTDAQLPLMITPHGHDRNPVVYAGIYASEKERIETEKNEKDIAVQAVKRGFLAILPVARGFGETRTPEDKQRDVPYSCRTLMMQDLLVGRTLIGDRVWDVIKLIDWALKEQPVDSSRIVVTGNSGGGTTTLFAGACDTRITMSIPSSYFSTFAGSIGAMYHCDCNYIPGILNYGEMADIAGLTAPRFFCALNGKYDPMFPIEEARQAFDKLAYIYAAAGVPNRCELYEGNGGHRYYKEGAWEFICKYLSLDKGVGDF